MSDGVYIGLRRESGSQRDAGGGTTDPRMEWTLADMPHWERQKAPKVDRAKLDHVVALYVKTKKLRRLAECKAAYPGESVNANQMAEEIERQIFALLPALGIGRAQLEELARNG